MTSKSFFACLRDTFLVAILVIMASCFIILACACVLQGYYGHRYQLLEYRLEQNYPALSKKIELLEKDIDDLKEIQSLDGKLINGLYTDKITNQKRTLENQRKTDKYRGQCFLTCNEKETP